MPKPIIKRISDQAVSEATGWGWDEWFAFLDERGAKGLEHKDVVRLLRDEGKVSKAWWGQTITVEYERARGLREMGEAADAGFEIGIRRTYDTAPRHAWNVLTKPGGIRMWLGVEDPLKLEKGTPYRATDGATGEIRTVTPGSRIRLTWRPVGGDKVSTIQLSVLPSGSKTVIAFHHENLSSFKEREKMRRHWNVVLGKLSEVW
jgi:uncharacterized protein YndB with AHSA1/START domain